MEKKTHKRGGKSIVLPIKYSPHQIWHASIGLAFLRPTGQFISERLAKLQLAFFKTGP